MLRIAPKKTFTCPVNLHVAGQQDPATINMTFNYLDREKLIDWQERNANKPINLALQEIIVSWDGVVFEDDEPAPYSPENLDKVLIGYHTFGDDVTQTFLRELVGARRKN